MDKTRTIMDGDILPVNGEAKYSFRLKDLFEITVNGWPPVEVIPLGWHEAKKK